MKKPCLWHYALAFLLSVAAALALLLFSALLPQGPIDTHVRDAALALGTEGPYPKTFDWAPSAQLDNYTDAIIMDVSRGTGRWDLSTVLTNPVHHSVKDPVEALADYAELEADAQAAFFYPRYWMGFRVLTRLALVFFNYLQIRRYLGFALLLLAVLTMLQVCREAGRRAALFFALSLLLVRPEVICQSIQFSCCFFLGMLGMLLVPRIRKRPELEGLFFMEMGIATMYFDFYTAPLLSFGYPMVYLCLLRLRAGERSGWREAGRNLLCWGLGYGLMWLTKLTLTTLLTPENAFESGFYTFRMWMLGEGAADSASPLLALNAVRHALTVDTTGAVVWAIALVGGLAALGVSALRGRLRLGEGKRSLILLALALLPLLWFAAAARPSVHHAWFQYRCIAMSFWAVGAWLSLLAGPRAERADRS